MEEELLPFLQGFWQNVIDDLVQSLKDVNRYASGNTAQDIGSFNVQPVKFISNTNFEITISMPTYAKFIDEGVSGALTNKKISQFKYTTMRPPISSIRQFMLNRGIVGRDYRRVSRTRGKKRGAAINTSLNRIAYAIAYNIWANGIEPTHFYSNVVNDTLLRNFERELVDQYGKLITSIIDIRR